jgi:hypothetical protein
VGNGVKGARIDADLHDTVDVEVETR